MQIDRLHDEYTILGLEQRRHKHLLRLINLHRKKENTAKRPIRLTRSVTKLVFKTASRLLENM